MEMQRIEFAQMGFGLSLVQYFLSVPSSLHFKMLIYILCHYKLEIGDLFLILILNKMMVKRLHESQKRL